VEIEHRRDPRFNTWFPGFQIVISSLRWQMIAPEQSGEESPNTIRQHAAENTRAPQLKNCGDGKCHREETAGSLATKVR